MVDDALMRHIWWPYTYGNPTIVRSTRTSLVSLSPKATVLSISLISLISCVLDKATKGSDLVSDCSNAVQRHVTCLRDILRDTFQAANLMLLLAIFMEWSSLMQVYVWFTLAFVVMGLMIAIIDFLFCFVKCGAAAAILLMVPEVTFLFVLFRCLPLVVRYGKDLETF